MQKEVYDFNRKMQQEIYYGFREKIESKKKRKKIYLPNILQKNWGFQCQPFTDMRIQAY